MERTANYRAKLERMNKELRHREPAQEYAASLKEGIVITAMCIEN